MSSTPTSPDETGSPGQSAFDQLDEAGHIRTISAPTELAPGVSARLTGGHSPGHLAIDVEGDARAATIIGHLAVTPFHVLDPTNRAQHADDRAGARAQRHELERAHTDGRLVAAPLWPAPGVGVVTALAPTEIAPAT